MLALLKSFSIMKLLKILSEGVTILGQRTVQSIDRAIGYYMVDEKLTQEAMANRLGMTANTLRSKRKGENDWTWSEVLRIAELVGKTPDVLAGLK